MSRERSKVDVGEVEPHLASGLRDIAVEEDTALATDSAECGDGLNRANLAAGCLDRHQSCLSTDRGLQLLWLLPSRRGFAQQAQDRADIRETLKAQYLDMRRQRERGHAGRIEFQGWMP
jgi:hypothetical protein